MGNEGMGDGWKPVHGRPGNYWMPCPHCGLELQRNDEALVMSHEAPLCEGFAARIRETLEQRPGAIKRVTMEALPSGRDGDN